MYIYYEVLLNQSMDERCARWGNTAVKRYTHAQGLRKARERQRQIVYKRVENLEKRRI